MKKIAKILSILSLLILLASCKDTDKDNISLETDVEEELTYSNLAGEKSQTEVEEQMLEYGLTQENVDRFLENLNDFNKTVENTTLIDDFFTINAYEIGYDDLKIMELWEKEKGLFIGNNCRMTTLDLLRDKIDFDKDENLDISNLFMDLDAISYDPKENIVGEELDLFKTFYARVKTENTKDINIHLDKMKDAFNDRNIRFKTGENISMINVVFHDSEDEILFIGHSGLLIDDKNSNLLFIEKLSFQEPYQAIKFNNRQQLNDYLMAKYDVSYNQPEAKPFIMENNELMDMYRPNQNNL